jgi:hypothetical protein
VTDEAMNPLRRRMIEDMTIRKLARQRPNKATSAPSLRAAGFAYARHRSGSSPLIVSQTTVGWGVCNPPPAPNPPSFDAQPPHTSRVSSLGGLRAPAPVYAPCHLHRADIRKPSPEVRQGQRFISARSSPLAGAANRKAARRM